MKHVKVLLSSVFLICMLTPMLFANDGVVHVVLFMHNEDSIFGDVDDPATASKYLRQRNGLVEMAGYLHENDVPFAWQSDWKFLQGVLKYETEELMDSTGGKNLVRYLYEDLGIAVDAHSHEHYGYNYADVACLLDSLGLTPTDIIGGHIWDPYNEKYADWERFRRPLQGGQFPDYTWEGRVLIGSGTPSHTYDPQPSGIWRPKDKYHYWEDDPEGKVVCVGQYTGDLEGVQELVQLYQTDAVSADQMLTCTIHTPQSFYPGFMEDFEKDLIAPLLEMRDRGEIKLVDFSQLVDIWESEFGGEAQQYNMPENSTPSQFSVFVPSIAGGEKGVFVQVSLPEGARFDNQQAPVVVHVAGGWDGLGVTEKSHGLTEQGFIELDFNFPGSGRPDQASGGDYDERGENCIQALADVAQFALGKKPDSYGYYLDDMIGELQSAADNVGLCGWSNGGNAAIIAAGAFGDDLQGLAWIVNWESPVGDGMPNVDAGVRTNLNPAYNPDTGEFDLSLLAYSEIIPGPDGGMGGLYFDINEDGALDAGVDFLATYRAFRGKSYYSDYLRLAADGLGITPAEHIATTEETTDFWHWRNGELWIENALSANPDLMFIVEAGDTDHVQGALDHPHVLIQYEGFRAAGARFVRLNPDRCYVEQVLGMPMPDAVDNDAFQSFDHISIRTAVQPRAIPALPSAKSVAAAVCEVADRTKDNNVEPQLGGDATSVTENLQAPRTMALAQNYPNPFNGRTLISFQLEAAAETALIIYDVTGRVVRQWHSSYSSGGHALAWDDLDYMGQKVSSGIYFYRLQTETGETPVRKMQFIK